MRFLFQSDIHFRSTTPLNRKDDYEEAQFSAFNQLLGWAEKYDCPILCGGDFFDTPSVSYRLYNRITDLLLSSEVSIITCIGQHDIYFHNLKSLKSTALWGLHLNGAVDVLNDAILPLNEKVFVHGVGWGMEPGDPVKGCVNILLAHISVFKNKVPFYFKHEAYTADSLREKYPGFDYYLCGDIHIPFVKNSVFVSGSMMRQNIDQLDYRPRAYLIDTEKHEYDTLFYEEEHDVFYHQELSTTENINVDDLVQALKDSNMLKRSFREDCMELAKTSSETTQKILKEILNGEG